MAGWSAESIEWRDLQPAPQVGPSCGFFANVPAVTLATGIDVGASKSFVRSVYGLRRGDFRFERSFDKRMFFELFALPYEEVKIEHAPGSVAERMPAVRELITGRLHEGLARGEVYSLRIRGVLGGPHNGLLVGRDGDRYVLHNPYPGGFQKLRLDQLANRMLVRSTARRNRGREVYVTHFLAVSLPALPDGPPIPVGRLPDELKVSLSKAQRQVIATRLEPARSPGKDADLSAYLVAYPDLDFAVLPGDGDRRPPRNVIGADLKAGELKGVIQLSKFALNVWQRKSRPLLPVVFMEGGPWVMTRYLSPVPGEPDKPTLVFDNGRVVRWLSVDEALEEIHRHGALHATLQVPRNASP